MPEARRIGRETSEHCNSRARLGRAFLYFIGCLVTRRPPPRVPTLETLPRQSAVSRVRSGGRVYFKHSRSTRSHTRTRYVSAVGNTITHRKMLATLGPGDHAEASPGARPGQRRPLPRAQKATRYSTNFIGMKSTPERPPTTTGPTLNGEPASVTYMRT